MRTTRTATPAVGSKPGGHHKPVERLSSKASLYCLNKVWRAMLCSRRNKMMPVGPVNRREEDAFTA